MERDLLTVSCVRAYIVVYIITFYRNIIKISEGPSNIFCPVGALASLWVSCAVWHRDTECILWYLDSTLIQRQTFITMVSEIITVVSVF